MKKIIITAETGSDIPKDLAQRHGIYLVPMHVTFGDVVKDDGSFSPYEIYEYYEKHHRVPTTSGCNPEDFSVAFQSIFAEHPDCHVIHMAYSAATTCSYQSARLAAEDYGNITHIDTKHVTVGQCAATIRLAEEMERHPEWSTEEADAAAARIAASVRMCFIPKNLDYLRAGGRVSNAAALCGNLLGLHPKIELLDGHLKATKKYRGKLEKVIPALVRDYTAEQNLDKQELWLGATVGFPEELKQTITKVAEELGFVAVRWITCGGVITTHGGPDGFCMAGFAAK